MSDILHIYTRVSTAVQADEGMSLDFQRELGEKRAKDLGFDFKVWNEGGKSSNHEEIDKRPVLSQLLTEIQRGAVKHLFVYDQSRLSRNDYVSSIFRYECNKHGVTLYNKEGKYDLANPQDQFLKQILDAVGQFDNAQRTERTRLGKLARIRQGYWLGGPPPYGYEIKDRKLVVNENESKWIRVIFERYADRVPLMDIKAELDRNGVEPRRKRGTWTLGSLQALLRNSHYVGHYDFKDGKSGEEIRTDCPPILSADLWTRVQATREQNMVHRSATNPVKHFYLLKTILRCGHCGTWMSGIYSEHQSKNHYYCPKKERQWRKFQIPDDEKWKRGRVCEMTRSLNLAATDDLVWNAVLDALSKSSLIKEAVKRDALGEGGQRLKASDHEVKVSTNRVRQLKKTLAKSEDSLTDLEAERLMGRITPAQYPKIKETITKETLQIKAEIERLEAFVAGVQQQKSWIDWVGKFRKKIDAYKSFTPEQKKELLQGLVTVIDVHLIDNQTHWLEVQFQLPLVDDNIEHLDVTKKSGYAVKDGTNALMIEMNSRPYAKKKSLQSMG
ncbi:recombinase family protein [Rhodoferax sp.]|uniref:recombinase family protein n=1 Tax=Rhodoferax sp. TaxID=50421 RepID=UPI00260D0184|nr:recombinase family protein [Rhodoferax sp.]MDD2918971.1 recombinase family protein [Rhodoferax sp.]